MDSANASPSAITQQLFVAFLLLGIILFCVEIFVPGGVLGAIAALALIGAIIIGFYAFPGYGGYIAAGILVLLVVSLVVWMRVFPKTRIGRRMTVSQDLASAKADESGLTELVDMEGEATTALRPAGFAVFAGRKVDVVTQGDPISRGERVRVIRVEGNRVVVAKV